MVVAAQIVTGVVLAGVLAVGGESRGAYSALVGTLAGAAPSFYLATRMFVTRAHASPQTLARAIYVGQTLKIAFASAVLVTALLFLDVSVGFLLAGYLATVLVNWMALLMPVPAALIGGGR